MVMAAHSNCMYDACVMHILFLAVFVVDSGFHVFVWVGKEATPHEKGGGLAIAHVSSSQCVSQWLTACIRYRTSIPMPC